MAPNFDEPGTDAERCNPKRTPVETLLRQIHALDEKESGIWAKNLLIIVVLCAGFLALVFPNLVWNSAQLRMDSRYLPQFFFGLTALLVLYNAHMIEQRGKLRWAREEMLRQLLRAEFTESLALVDPLTEVYNRRHLDKILHRETSRADRSNASLAVMLIDMDGFKSINTRFGHNVGDEAIREVARLLNGVFRRSDTVVRYGGDEFLIVMPDTNEEQAGFAKARLQKEVRKLNLGDPNRGFQLSLSCGVAAYRKGMQIREVIGLADGNMYTEKATHHAPLPDSPAC